jgi:cobyrinic acid a,c-diamide synthase
VVHSPRLILAGLSGGSGKTIVSLGLCSIFRQHGQSVQPFKKGPDYIDAAWLSLAAGRRASNLDPFLMPAEQVKALFWERSKGADLSVIEGSRGLFDGKDVQGSCSTSELSKLLDAPVLLVVDCTKMTRTVAALVLGCHKFDPGMRLSGVILNRTAGERHRAMLTKSVETYTDVPVLGALPKLTDNPIPERHMGLVSDREFDPGRALDVLGQTIGRCLDTAKILELSRSAPQADSPPPVLWPESGEVAGVRIGYVRDAALWFYYGENLEALRRAGAELVELSIVMDDEWPLIDGLYLGGGFPETQARVLAANKRILRHIHRLAESGMPVYAECGGLMYLGRSIVCDGREHPMAGVLPFKTELCVRPQGLGYTQVRVCRPNPFHQVGTTFCGHEFHYSRLLPADEPLCFALEMIRGEGASKGNDGIVRHNVFACYTHIHALGVPGWADRFVSAAGRYRLECTRQASGRIASNRLHP